MSIDMPLEEAPLSQLQQTPIDNVLHIIDEGLVYLPTYRELYYRWERQQWKAQDIDFSDDRKQWEAMSQDEREMRIYALSAFFQGEACVTDTLAPYVLAMPDEDMRIFLTTQLVDEARHTVFFERFFRKVMGIETDKIEDSLAVARDESRHVVFGVKFLRDMIRRDNAHAKVVHEAIDRYAPIAIAGISPDPDVVQRVLAMGGDPWVSPRYAVDSLTKKLKVIGIRISTALPEVPPPPLKV